MRFIHRFHRFTQIFKKQNASIRWKLTCLFENKSHWVDKNAPKQATL